MSEIESDNSQRPFGILAEFDDVDRLLAAAQAVRDRGYRRWDAYTPYPVHGLDGKMGIKPTVLPWIVLMAGLAGLGGGLFLAVWTNALSFEVPTVLQGYRYIISGKPFMSIPAFVPVIFETTVLLAAFGAVLGMLLLNGLPRLYHPLFTSRRFRRVTNDRFFIAIESSDPKYDSDGLRSWFAQLGAIAVEEIKEGRP